MHAMQFLWHALKELLTFVALAVIIVLPIRLFVAQPFVVEGQSMAPTFEDGDYLIVDEISYRMTSPKRGDVVVFRYPGNTSVFYIKRIVGLPGETVHIDRGVVTITKTDDTKVTLEEPYVAAEDASYSPDKHLGQGQYYVLGDNRANSSDSRVWGVLPVEDIMGKPALRLLPISQSSWTPGSITLPQ